MQFFDRSQVARLIVFAATISPGALADVEGPQISFSPHVGAAIWEASDVDLEEDVLFGGSLTLAPSAWLAFEGSYDVNPTGLIGNASSTYRVSHLGAGALLNLAPYHAVSPYFSFGWSNLLFDPAAGGERSFDGWAAGMGFRFRVATGNGKQVNLRLDARNIMTKMDQGFLAVTDADATQHNVFVSLGLEFAMGGPQTDNDRDGVVDRRDLCPTTPRRAIVDAQGCALDGDLDTVADGLDLCANTPAGARVDAMGCPTDVDQDGVFDGIDRCDDTPLGAVVDQFGCVKDADADGVADGIDQCPDTPAGLAVDGKGCALDSDGDGVNDKLDKCAGTPAGVKVDGQGCPIVQNERERELLDTGMLRLENVYFESGKSELKSISFGPLDELGEILVRWPQLRIEIGGHTDSVGDEAMNQRLSEARAQSVFDYLQRRFPQIQFKQFTVRGYGESKSIASNDNANGRARNRRVEFTVMNREVLSR